MDMQEPLQGRAIAFADHHIKIFDCMPECNPGH